VRDVELVTAHEYGHQYFYGLVASNENRWPFLDEGVNSFAEADAVAAWLGPGSAAEVAGLTVSDAAIQAVLSNLVAHNERVAQPAPSFQLGLDYNLLVYHRTATILQTLRGVYGDDPLYDALGRYARKQRFAHPTPDEFVASIEEVLGPQAGANLRIALFERGWVDYAVLSVDSNEVRDPRGIFDRPPPSDVTPTTRYLGSVVVARRGNLTFPVDVELTSEDGSTQRIHWNGEGDAARFAYAGTSPLRAAVVDPDDRVLLDASRRNNFESAPAAARSRAPRTAERLLYWAELALQQVLP
jgi:aminopeptidase N